MDESSLNGKHSALRKGSFVYRVRIEKIDMLSIEEDEKDSAYVLLIIPERLLEFNFGLKRGCSQMSVSLSALVRLVGLHRVEELVNAKI